MEMSKADQHFIEEMTAHHKAAINMARDYLKTSPSDRLATLSEMARGIITAQTAEMAKMAKMAGKSRM